LDAIKIQLFENKINVKSKIPFSIRTLIISPLHEHFQFGIPLIFLLLIWLCNFKRNINKKFDLILILFFYLFIIILYGSEIARQSFSLLPLLYLAVGKYLRNLEESFIKLGIVFNIILSLLYIY